MQEEYTVRNDQEKQPFFKRQPQDIEIPRVVVVESPDPGLCEEHIPDDEQGAGKPDAREDKFHLPEHKHTLFETLRQRIQERKPEDQEICPGGIYFHFNPSFTSIVQRTRISILRKLGIR